MTTVLAIDTASQRFALALAVDGEIVEAIGCDEPQRHTRLLVPWIDRLLGGRRRDLGGIVVVQGPGSYAGLRVGLATATALALATGAARAGVTVFEALAAVDPPPGRWTAVQPLGRDRAAVQDFAGAAPIGEPRSVPFEEIDGLLRGEGAGLRGGVEVGPAERVNGALRAGLVKLAAHESGDPAAYYLSEPGITAAKRTPLTAATQGA